MTERIDMDFIVKKIETERSYDQWGASILMLAQKVKEQEARLEDFEKRATLVEQKQLQYGIGKAKHIDDDAQDYDPSNTPPLKEDDQPA